MTLRNSIAEQRWIAALDQRERRVWTQLVCVCVCCTLHWYLGQCVTLCVCVCVCQRDRRHPARSLWKGTAMPGPSRSPPPPPSWLSSLHRAVLSTCSYADRVTGKLKVNEMRPVSDQQRELRPAHPLTVLCYRSIFKEPPNLILHIKSFKTRRRVFPTYIAFTLLQLFFLLCISHQSLWEQMSGTLGWEHTCACSRTATQNTLD